MTLDNLLATGQLLRQPADKSAIQKLLAAAARNLADTALAGLSADNRFDAAYKTIMPRETRMAAPVSFIRWYGRPHLAGTPGSLDHRNARQ